MKALIVKEDGLIYAAELPVGRIDSNGLWSAPESFDWQSAEGLRLYKELANNPSPEHWYEKALASAKESAVLVSDQEKAIRLIYENLGETTPIWNGWINMFKKNAVPKVYPIPGLQWEVKEETIGVLSGASPFGSVSEFREVAILKESSDHIADVGKMVIPSTESQEELWESAEEIARRSLGDRDSSSILAEVRAKWVIEDFKKQFNITRRKP